jgi:hypothetical protein
MKIKNYLVAVIMVATLLFGCKKDAETAPDGKMGITENFLTGKVNAKTELYAVSNDGRGFQHEWKLDGKVVSTAYNFAFIPTTSGTYIIEYKGYNGAGSFSHTYTINVPVPVIAVTPTSSKFISKVFEYAPAPGQHINNASLGSPEQAQKLIGSTNNMVSLGGFGGYIVFGFDHSVVNQNGADLAIYGNPFGPPYAFAEPGIVMVSQDKNGNGLPDDEWFELAGSEYEKATTIKNYEITYTNPKAAANVAWTDNQGNSGVINNSAKRINFYPLFAFNQDKITFKGTLLPSTLSTSGIVTNAAFDWGYTDSYSTGDDYKTKLYNSFDIAWAVDGAGKKVSLSTIDFVKVYTAQNVNAGILGEISTDVKGATDLNIK